MPKKTPEEVREQAVALRKAGHSYTQIERGTGLTRPTVIKILKEAGLTKASAPAAVTTTGPSRSASTPSVSPRSPAHTNSAVPVAATDGVSDFMPKQKPKAQAQAAAGPIEFTCDGCGEEFVADSEADLPETCPECGA